MANVLCLLAIEEGFRDGDHRLSWTAAVQLCQVRWPWPPQALADGHICLYAASDDAGHMVFRTQDGTVLLELCLDETCQILKGISPRMMTINGTYILKVSLPLFDGTALGCEISVVLVQIEDAATAARFHKEASRYTARVRML